MSEICFFKLIVWCGTYGRANEFSFSLLYLVRLRKYSGAVEIFLRQTWCTLPPPQKKLARTPTQFITGVSAYNIHQSATPHRQTDRQTDKYTYDERITDTVMKPKIYKINNTKLKYI